jgi:hypothetical protein
LRQKQESEALLKKQVQRQQQDEMLLLEKQALVKEGQQNEVGKMIQRDKERGKVNSGHENPN